MARPVRVLSLQTTMLGNRTYGELLRRGFQSSSSVDFEARWSPEATEMRSRVLRAFFWRGVPVRWLRERNLDFFKARFELGTSLLARSALRSAIREVSPDVVHVHTQSLALLSNDVLRRLPCVVSADMTARQSADQETTAAFRWTYEVSHQLERRILRNASAVVTLSRWAADAMIADYDLAPQRVHAIPPGTDLQAFDEILQRRRQRREDRPLSILFVGGEYERKGGDLLVRTFMNRFAGRNIILNLVTHSAHIPQHNQIKVYRGVRPFSPEWSTLYSDADIFVLPTRRDASPHVIIEAMASGIPAIATAVGSIAEAIVDEETGYVIRPNDEVALADRIEQLLSDPDRRARFGAAARIRAEQRYDAKENIDRLTRVFVDVAKERK